ncbi:DUF6448 family protein [Phycicoccus sp.]|uniref:DUF6448 family protein n=1 Tax=Phycicoccus sp. TaxID=1902410 RepID=UPI002C39EC2F|nr:DUF6448 family protein [Phycicoccus sp.]HMM95831.1 DUF6448 family protein [Phycicoccus sp.]
MNVIQTLRDLLVRPASAHCDTEDGPAVVDGRRALEEGNVNIALKWVHPDGEAEVREAYDKARRVRAAGGEAAEVADRWFLETLVRVHRAGEGAGFDGIKPAWTPIPPEVAAADLAIERRSIDPLRGLVADERWAELERRFDRAVSLRDFDPDDLDAARRYMQAYVSFFKYAEGHDHGHGHDEQHAHHAHAH